MTDMTEGAMNMMDLACAPKATDDLEDIEFDDDDEKSERDFIEGWIREEKEYDTGIDKTLKKMEERYD
jgi:hypothetical protein